MRRAPVPDVSRAWSSSWLSWLRSGCGRRSAGSSSASVAQDAEQPSHLGQRRAGGVADRRQLSGSGIGKPGRGQPGCLGLHGDHRDVVGDDVVQLAGDARPLAARGVLDQRAGDRPAGPRRCTSASACARPRDARPAAAGAQRRQHDGQDGGLRRERDAGPPARAPRTASPAPRPQAAVDRPDAPVRPSR